MSNNKDNGTVSVRAQFRTYIRDKCKPGDIVDWLSVEMGTGIETKHNRIRAEFRAAARAEGRHIRNIHGNGVEFSAPETAVGLVAQRRLKVQGAVRKASQYAEGILKEHQDNMTESAKKEVIREMSVQKSVAMFLSSKTVAPSLAEGG